jgi:hypothetical protein
MIRGYLLPFVARVLTPPLRCAAAPSTTGDGGLVGDLDGVQQLPPAPAPSSRRSNFADHARRGRSPTELAGRDRGTKGGSGGTDRQRRGRVGIGIGMTPVAIAGRDRAAAAAVAARPLWSVSISFLPSGAH